MRMPVPRAGCVKLPIDALDQVQKGEPTGAYGVGTLIALTYILTIEDAERFEHSHDVGAFLEIQPKQRESGSRQPELESAKPEIAC